MKHTIIMSGGLGNQMFQYAFYLSMKAKGKKCKIDDTLFYITKMHNGFELKQVFQLQNSLNKPSLLKKIWMQLLRRFKPSLLLCTDSVYQYAQRFMKADVHILWEIGSLQNILQT